MIEKNRKKNRIKYLNGANKLHSFKIEKKKKHFFFLLSLNVNNVIFDAGFKNNYKNSVSRTT